jgi:DNA invertase Pin-like site-specific DNA recombinase
MNSVAQYERELITGSVVPGLESAMKRGRIGGRPINLTDVIKLKAMELKENGIGIKKKIPFTTNINTCNATFTNPSIAK